MARPAVHSREKFLKAALSIVDSEGLDALTFRRLGTEVGVSYTAAYTYFKNREELIGALVNNLFAEIVLGVKVIGTTKGVQDTHNNPISLRLLVSSQSMFVLS